MAIAAQSSLWPCQVRVGGDLPGTLQGSLLLLSGLGGWGMSLPGPLCPQILCGAGCHSVTPQRAVIMGFHGFDPNLVPTGAGGDSGPHWGLVLGWEPSPTLLASPGGKDGPQELAPKLVPNPPPG